MNFKQFTKSELLNAWLIEYRTLKLYVRKTPPILKSELGDYQLASMVSKVPGSGLLTRFLNTWEPKYQFHIENVLNTRLISYFEKRGYKIVSVTPSLPCMLGPKPKRKKKCQ